jgi:hypothetical protein
MREVQEQAGQMQIVPSGSASSPPFLRCGQNARPECTTISGDHLVEDEESPLPQMRKGCLRLCIEMPQPKTTKNAAFVLRFFDDLDSMQDAGRVILRA